jgi:hypothetical protein
VARRKADCMFYKDEKAAIEKHGMSKKLSLRESPFTRLFVYGANNNGYWTCDFMVLHMEDCIDCLQILFPGYDFVLLFDHSNEHDRLQPDGLNINRMNKNYGGSNY